MGAFILRPRSLEESEKNEGGRVVAVHARRTHGFSKDLQSQIWLIENLGVEGDAHAGVTVQHIWSARKTPQLPNLRQVHLIEHELLDELRLLGFIVRPGELGENVTTNGIDLTSLPASTRLSIGAEAVIEITGLRQPCVKIERFASGLRQAVSTPHQTTTALKRSVMGIVLKRGMVRANDAILAAFPPEPHVPLALV